MTSMKYRCLAAAVVMGLGLMSGQGAMGSVLEGPLQDVLTPGTSSSNFYISIHSEFDSITDDITISWNRAVTATAAGYVQTTSDPSTYLVTTIYGDELSQAPLLIGGMNPGAPDFVMAGGEHIHGSDGLVYSSGNGTPMSFGQMTGLGLDLSPFNPGDPGVFDVFQTLVPASALAGVPEPASLGVLTVGAGLLSLRRRRRA